MNTKEQRKLKAQAHYEYTQQHYANDTYRTVNNSFVYDECKFVTESSGKTPTIEIWASTAEAAVRNMGNQCCVLNFASYTRPGGGFINGAIAQEEALCHSSNLYDVLVTFTDAYNKNFKSKNHGIYKDWAIWSPNICFIYNENTQNEEVIYADVITCPAPNYSHYSKDVIMGQNPNLNFNDYLVNRCKYVLDIAEKHGTKNLILGAFGCGVFSNDPYKVATIFKGLLMNKTYNFDKVVFAIPNFSNDNNLTTFKTVFENE